MNRTGFLFATFAVLAAAVSCGTAVQQDDDRIKVILETDIGNDVDDALALDMLHKYIDDGTVDVLAIMINKNGEAPAEFTDIMNTWYGHPDIPILNFLPLYYQSTLYAVPLQV